MPPPPPAPPYGQPAGGPQPAQTTPPLIFTFDGGAASYIGIQILGFLITVITLGICFPWAVCMRYRWRCEHTMVNGYRLRFIGNAMDLFVHWIGWLLLCFITLGIYSFWVTPRVTKWVVERQRLDPQPITYPQQAAPVYR
jgi:uncharacterized membrane protein YjgN (DUF898 family)